MSGNDDGCGRDRDASPLSIKDLIPGSRLAALGGDLLYASDPPVCDGDDVYEVNLTGGDSDDNVRRDRSAEAEETWMSQDTERTFLKHIMDGGTSEVDNLIEYVEKNHWFGGKNIFLNLDVGKTILNRSSKLVLHNSRPQNTLNYYVSNLSKYSKPSKKTNFILEDWPYASFNRLLISNGNEDELTPWIRNNRFNTHLNSTATSVLETPIDQHQVTQLQEQQKQQQYEYQQQEHQQYQYQQQQQHQYQQQQHQQQQYQQQQYQQQQHQQHLYQQHLYQQQHQQQEQQQRHIQQQQQQQQRSNIFFPFSSPHQVLMFGRPPMIPYLANFPHLQRWPSNFYQRFSTPLPLPTSLHYYWNPINTADLRAATVQHDRIKYGNNLVQHPIHFQNAKVPMKKNNLTTMSNPCTDSQQLLNAMSNVVNDEWIDKMLSTIETNNKDALRSFLILLKNVYPKRIEEFKKLMSAMDYMSSYPPILTNKENCSNNTHE